MKLTMKYIFTSCCLFMATVFIVNFTKSTISQYSLSAPVDNFEQQQTTGDVEDFNWTKISGILKRRKASLEQWCLENKKMQVPRFILSFFTLFLLLSSMAQQSRNIGTVYLVTKDNFTFCK